MFRNFCVILFFFLIAFSCGAAQPADSQDLVPSSDRPVTSSFMLEAGSAHLADTYLTPLHYRGFTSALAYERTQAMKFAPEQWLQQLCLCATIERAQNPVRNATMLGAEGRISWSMLRNWQLLPSLTLSVGPRTSLGVGALYLSRNGNNPASARAAFTFDATAMASWRTSIFGVPATLRYQPSLPVVGAFFSPDYGKLYYQIYLGDSKGLVHPAWWGNYFLLDNLLTLDLRFGATSLRLGYHNRVFSSKTNNIVTRDISHAAVLGITLDWVSLRTARK